MTQTRFKKVPFDLELAKKITNKEMKGQIVTENGLTARKVCFDLKYGESKIIAALVDCGDYKIWVRYDLDGTCRDTRKKINLIFTSKFQLTTKIILILCHGSGNLV